MKLTRVIGFIASAAVMLAVAGVARAQVGTSTADQGTGLGGTVSQYVRPQFRLNPDGTILVRGVTVSAMNGSSIQGTFSYGPWQTPLSITLSPNARMYDRAGVSTNATDIVVGDVISFSGTVTDQGIVATVVRNWTPAGAGGTSGTGTGGAGTLTPNTGNSGTDNSGMGGNTGGTNNTGGTGGGSSGGTGTGSGGSNTSGGAGGTGSY